MTDIIRPLLRSLSGAALALLLAVPATAGERPYFSWNGDARVPDCEAMSVQSAVMGHIARADPDYTRGLKIRDMHRIVETGYTVNQPSPYARRYCEARARMSDGHERRVYYAIMEHSGFVGVSWNLQACVAGLDPWRVYDAGCRTVRPN